MSNVIAYAIQIFSAIFIWYYETRYSVYHIDRIVGAEEMRLWGTQMDNILEAIKKQVQNSSINADADNYYSLPPPIHFDVVDYDPDSTFYYNKDKMLLPNVTYFAKKLKELGYQTSYKSENADFRVHWHCFFPKQCLRKIPTG